MIPVNVIGMGMSPKDLTQIQKDLIAKAEVLVGGRRHLEFFAGHGAQKIEITRHIDDMIAQVKNASQTRHVVFLASGDPLFYGIGSTLIEKLGAPNVVIHPNISSVCAAFAKIKMAWHDAAIISLHGKDDRHFIEQIAGKNKIAVLTDPRNHPGRIARLLQSSGNTEFKICVVEQLGLSTEKVGWYDIADMQEMTFADPNLVVLLKENQLEPDPLHLYIGMPDDDFAHQKGLITKAEIRAVTLARLQLQDHHIFWDLGAGSGSVSIEAGVFIKNGKIIAVEKNPDRIADIKINRDRYNVRNIQVVQAELPEGLESYADPDRIFIGGSGRQLQSIVQMADQRLKPGGRLVINTVILANMHTGIELLEQRGYLPDLVQLQVSQAAAMPFDRMLKALNPVWIISGQKPSQGNRI